MKPISNLVEILDKNLDFNNFIKNKIKNKDKILKFLKNQKILATATSYFYNDITNSNTNIPLVAYTDNTYVWDTRDIYYFEHYDLKLNDDFIEYVLNKVT
jgi:hypothetical protein